MNAPKGGGLQMDRDERETQLLMRDVRPADLCLGGKHCLGWVKASNDFIDWLYDWEYHAFRKNFEAFFGIPKIRVLDDGLIIFSVAETEKFQARVTRLGLDKLT